MAAFFSFSIHAPGPSFFSDRRSDDFGLPTQLSKEVNQSDPYFGENLSFTMKAFFILSKLTGFLRPGYVCQWVLRTLSLPGLEWGLGSQEGLPFFRRDAT